MLLRLYFCLENFDEEEEEFQVYNFQKRKEFLFRNMWYGNPKNGVSDFVFLKLTVSSRWKE